MDMDTLATITNITTINNTNITTNITSTNITSAGLSCPEQEPDSLWVVLYLASSVAAAGVFW